MSDVQNNPSPCSEGLDAFIFFFKPPFHPIPFISGCPVVVISYQVYRSINTVAVVYLLLSTGLTWVTMKVIPRLLIKYCSTVTTAPYLQYIAAASDEKVAVTISRIYAGMRYLYLYFSCCTLIMVQNMCFFNRRSETFSLLCVCMWMRGKLPGRGHPPNIPLKHATSIPGRQHPTTWTCGCDLLGRGREMPLQCLGFMNV